MIRILKPTDSPQVLKSKGVRATRAMVAAFEESPQEYQRAVKTFEFDSKIYGHAQVKSALLACQHDKCCFCESHVRHIAHGDVEHYRPKAGWQQRRDETLTRPGYYWLAYDWTNLLFSCQLCNQQGKGNLFPLRDHHRRATTHRHAIEEERPLLINPAIDDPEKFVAFREEIAVPLRRSRRGRATIDICRLNRQSLIEVRLKQLTLVKLVRDNLNLVRLLLAKRDAHGAGLNKDLSLKSTELEKQLVLLTGADAQFSSMSRCALAVAAD